MTTMTERRAKYTDAEVEAMGKKGQAFKNPDGSYSYPIADAADLDNAIRAVGRGGADHDAIRKYIIGRAKTLGKSSEIPDNWNADGSLSESKRAPRPGLELLKRRRGSMIRKAERRGVLLEMRAKPDGTGGTTFEFEGYGATFDQPFDMWDPWGDPYTEVVRQGAFTRTLAAGPDVPFLVGHNDMGIPLARTKNGTMQLSQDDHGLLVRAQMDGSRSDVKNLASAVDRGDLDEMSIGFVTMGQEWSPDWETRAMTDLELHRGDVSAVALAANPGTAGATMTALPAETLRVRKPGEQRTPTQPYSAHEGEVNACPQCHSVNDDAASYCDQCGTAMQPTGRGPNMPGVEDMTQRCGECLKWNSADAKYCGGCGEELAGDQGRGWDLAWKAGRPGERRVQSEIQDVSSRPDFNLPPDAPAYDPSPHGKNSLACPSNDCPVYAGGDGDRALNASDAKFCDQCGAPLYSADGLIVADDSGVVEEAGGDLADADLLSLRLRLLELA